MKEGQRKEREEEKIQKMVKDAEQSKPKMVRPTGMDDVIYTRDDQFFHYTAHIDKSLREKIKKGEFVDLFGSLVRNSLVKDFLSFSS